MALADPWKFTTIAHGNHRYCSPLSTAKAAMLIDLFAPEPGGRVLDIGCGRAGFLMDVVADFPVHGVGVDANATFIAQARAKAAERSLAGRLTLIATPLAEAAASDDRYAGVICMGSSQAVGSLADALAWAWQRLQPGGTALFADGYWKQPPAQDYLDVLGATADEMASHAGNAALARAAGFRVLATATASDDEWDEYEGLYCAAVERHVAAHPDDPDADAMARRIRPWHDAYLRWGRDTLGFGFYCLLKSAHTTQA